jgi:hypothetical protein
VEETVITELLEKVEHEWRDELSQVGIRIRPPLYGLKIGDRSSMNRKINILVFNHREKQPALILRIAQTEEQRTFLNNEYKTLSGLAGQTTLSSAIPLPLSLFEFQKKLVAVERSLAGVSLFALLLRRKHTRPSWVQHDFRLACDFLCELERATLVGSVSFHDAANVDSKLAQLDNSYGSINWPKGYKERILEIANSYQSLRLRQCARHGDFWFGNLLISPQGLGVIDWEGYAHPDLVFHDIFFFMTTYALFYPWRGWNECPTEMAFRLGFIESNWLSEMIKDTLVLFFQRLNIPPRAIYLLLNLFLIEMSLPSAIANDPRYPPQYSKWFGLFQTFMQGKSLLLDD